MTRRPAHKLAHSQCPYGAFNWADCDSAASHRWGRCTAMVDVRPEPHTCTNWAVAEDGWCGQHFIALHEKAVRKARQAEAQLQLAVGIDAFLAKTSGDGFRWWEGLATSAESIRGLAGVGGPGVRVLVRKPPHRLTELD